MKYKYLLFDADNTLFDFNKAERKAFLGLSEIDEIVFCEENYERYHEINDKLWKKLERKETTKAELRSARFAELYLSLGLEVNTELIERITATYPKKLGLGCDLLDGARGTLAHLSNSYQIYIVTNGLSEVQKMRLERSSIKGYIIKMFVSEDVGFEKPDKRYFDHVLACIGDYDQNRYLVIGDSLTSDIDGAILYGIDCVYFDPNKKGTSGRDVTHIITNLDELCDVLSNV